MLSATSTISVAEDSQLEDSYLSIQTNPNESLPNAVAADADSSSALGSSLNSGVLASEDAATESTTNDETSTSVSAISSHVNEDEIKLRRDSPPQRKLISLEPGLLDEYGPSAESSQQNSSETVYRRIIIPEHIPDSSPFRENDIVPGSNQPSERQCEKLKENKESQNKNRQSQGQAMPLHSSSADVESIYGSNKSSYGKWKRRKGPAPALPVPPRKVLQMLPLQDIRHELEIIEVQQQGLEKQVI